RVEVEDPGHPGREKVRLRVGVLTDDHVPLLETEHALRLEPEGGRAGGDERIPEVLGRARRAVELVAELADEPDPEGQAGDARDDELPSVEIAERVGRDVRVGEPRESLARARPCKVDRTERAGDVDDLRVVAP